MKVRAYPLLISLVLITSVLVIALRGVSPQTTAFQLDGLQNASSIQGLRLGSPVWVDNFTGSNWHLSAPNATQASLEQTGILNLNVMFTNQQTPQATTVSRAINISLDENPTVIGQITVSRGIHYGIRFSGVTLNGQTFDAWTEGSSLQHRPGLGSEENVSSNLAREFYLANNQYPVQGSRITKVWFYIEATSGTIGQFSMKVVSLQVFLLSMSAPSSRELSGNFQGIMVNLNLPSTSQSLFQAYVGFDIRGSSNLQYTPFLVDRASVLAQGFGYAQNKITTYEIAVLTTTLALGFPPFLPPRNSTAIIIGPTSGEVSYFKLDSLSFKFTSTPIQEFGEVDPSVARIILVYYFLFLFVTPIAAVVLLTKVFNRES